MENRNSAEVSSRCVRRLVLSPSVVLSTLILSFLAVCGGCAAPAEPTERKPVVPAAVTDLAARQLGNEVILTFTLPKQTADQRPLKATPAIEIYRGFRSTGGTPAPAPTLLVTIPAAMAAGYAGEQGTIRYVDSLSPGDFQQASEAEALYVVRTRASVKRESADSNRAALPIFLAPDPIDDLSAQFSRAGVALKWSAPAKKAGAPYEIVGYHIYRRLQEGSTTPAEAATAAARGEKPKSAAAPQQVGASVSTEYNDTSTEYGRTYLYFVRSVAKYPSAALESGDSNPASVTTKDVFPPAAPQGLVVLLVPAQGDAPAHLELSWAINSETDLAGYNVYRSGQVDVPGTRQNTELLRTPAFRDMNAVPGHRYFYSVTAVDRSGNESSASAAVSGSVSADQTP
jgi:hypothetical protein